MVMNTYPDEMQVLFAENIFAFFGRLQNDMPAMVTKVFRKIIPFPENKIEHGYIYSA